MTAKFTLRLPAELRDRLKAAAKAEGLSLNQIIVRVLAGQQAAPKGEK